MYKAFKYKIFPTEPQKELIAKRYLCMRSRGIWLTVLMRGVQLNSLTPSNGGTTAPISYTQCYKSGGGQFTGYNKKPTQLEWVVRLTLRFGSLRLFRLHFWHD